MNINEIAQRANVSRSTVSRVLNKHPRVKEETRQAVLRVMEEMHYIPSAAARSLASKRNNIIGMLVYNIAQPFWAGVFSGVEQYISQHTDLGLFLANSKSHLDVRDYKEDYKRNLRNLVQRGVDGVIIALANDVQPDDIDFLQSSQTPFVIIQNYLEDARITSINVDNVDGAYQATRHLLQLGHRHIVHAAGPLDSGISRDRMQGYVQAMQEAGLPLGASSVVNCGFLFDDGYWCMKRLLAEESALTAVLFANDATAFGGYLAAREAGVSIPEQLSVVGFDHLTEEMDVAGLLPDLTTVSQPVLDIGSTAAELLVRQLSGDATVQPARFPMCLYQGGTTRKPARKNQTENG